LKMDYTSFMLYISLSLSELNNFPKALEIVLEVLLNTKINNSDLNLCFIIIANILTKFPKASSMEIFSKITNITKLNPSPIEYFEKVIERIDYEKYGSMLYEIFSLLKYGEYLLNNNDVENGIIQLKKAIKIAENNCEIFELKKIKLFCNKLKLTDLIC